MLWLAVMLPGLISFAPQDATPASREAFGPPGLVRGVIRAVDGTRIASATAAIEPSLRGGEPARELLVALVGTRIPPVLIDDEGAVVLPLADLHRRTFVPELGDLELVVEADGYHRRRVPLPTSLEGLISLDAELEPVMPGDVLHLDLGLFAHERRFLLETGVGNEVFDAVTIEVPADGRAAVPVPPRPSSAQLGHGSEPAFWWRRAALLAPGVSSGFVRIGTGVEGPTWAQDTAGEARPSLTVRRRDGAPLEGLAGLYELADGSRHWLRLAEDTAPRDGLSELVAVVATGTRAVAVRYRDRELELPERLAIDRLSVVVQSGGEPVGDAELTVWDLSAIREVRGLLQSWPGTRPLGRAVRTSSSGRADLTALSRDRPVALVARARGRRPVVVIDPQPSEAGADCVIEWEPPRTAVRSQHLRICDSETRPIHGALVVLGDRLASLLPDADLPLRTDALGRVEVLFDLPGTYPIRVAAAGHAPCRHLFGRSAAADPADPSSVDNPAVDAVTDLVLEPARELRIASVDQDGGAVPWAPVIMRYLDRSRGVPQFSTDSRGRGWLRRVPSDLHSLQVAEDLRAGGGFQWPDDGELLTLPAWPVRPVMLLTPETAGDLRVERLRGAGGASTSGSKSVTYDSRRSDRLVLAWREGAGDRLHIGLGAGPPLRLGDEVVAAAVREGVQFAVIDQRVAIRRVPLLLAGVPAESLGALRVETRSPHYGGAMYSNRGGNLCEIDADGRAWIVLRDTHEADLVVLHPAALPKQLKLPAAEAHDDAVPLGVDLTAGTSIEIEFPGAGAGVSDLQVMIRGQGPNQNRSVVAYLQDRIEVTGARGAPVRLSLPCALEPGTYAFRLSGTAVKTSERVVEVAEQPVVVAFPVDDD